MTNKAMVRKQIKLKRQKQPPTCPECGSATVVPIIHGIITPSLQKSIDEGKAIRADREEWEEIQETGELPAGSLRIVSWQSVNELPRSKLTGCQNIAMRIDPKGVTPECFNRGSSSGLAWIPDKNVRK